MRSNVMKGAGQRLPLRRLGALLLVIAALGALFPAPNARADDGREYIVCLTEEARRDGAFLAEDGHFFGPECGDGTPAFVSVDGSTLREMLRSGDVAWYEEDCLVTLEDPLPAADGDFLARLQGGENWHLSMTGADQTIAAGYTGQGVTVGVIDSGCSSHPEVADKLLPGWDYLNNSADTRDQVGHGTIVCGLIAGSTVGVAPGAAVVPLKCFDSSTTNISYICAALYGAVDTFHCDVINLSLGVGIDSDALVKAAAYAINSGVALVCAGGNGGTKTIVFPAGYEGPVGVGSVDSNRNVYYRSNHNESIFITAPGVSVRSSNSYGGYSNHTGTSFATPQVSGAVAVLMGIDPELTAEECLNFLAETAVDRGEPGYDDYYGWGVLNVAGAVQAALEAIAARTPKTFDVTYDAAGGSGAPEPQTKLAGEPLTLRDGVPSREGYVFRGWAVTGDSAEALYQPGDTYSADAELPLYALWAAVYTVTYDAAGGSDAPEAQFKTELVPLRLQETAPSRTGYVFQYWISDDTTVYNPGEVYTAEADLLLRAVWEKETYQLRYDAAGGSGSPEDETKTYGEPLLLSETVPSREGYTFLGWATESGMIYQPGDVYAAETSETLYAVWRDSERYQLLTLARDEDAVTLTLNREAGKDVFAVAAVYSPEGRLLRIGMKLGAGTVLSVPVRLSDAGYVQVFLIETVSHIPLCEKTRLDLD